MSCFDDPFSAYNNMPARHAGSDGAADSKPLPFTPAKMSAEEWRKQHLPRRTRSFPKEAGLYNLWIRCDDVDTLMEAYASYREGRE